MANVITATKRTVCEGSEQPSNQMIGTKNPCTICGHMTTTKRDGNQRRHVAKKIKK